MLVLIIISVSPVTNSWRHKLTHISVIKVPCVSLQDDATDSGISVVVNSYASNWHNWYLLWHDAAKQPWDDTKNQQVTVHTCYQPIYVHTQLTSYWWVHPLFPLSTRPPTTPTHTLLVYSTFISIISLSINHPTKAKIPHVRMRRYALTNGYSGNAYEWFPTFISVGTPSPTHTTHTLLVSRCYNLFIIVTNNLLLFI